MKLLAIDGNSLINRAFYGLKSALTSPDGIPTNAIHGFLNMLFKLEEEVKADTICVCFDRREKTFRHEAYEGYKAQRKPMPQELAVQLPLLRQALELMGIACLDLAGYEADDLLGTLARKCRERGDECVIVTGDRDSLQFIAQGAQVDLIRTQMGQTTTEPYTEAYFKEQYRGLTPDKIVDLKAIMGDASDNIPGVKGIGEKGAMELLELFGSLDGIYQNLEDPRIKPAQRKKLEEGQEMARLSYQLAMGNVEVPIEQELTDLARKPMEREPLYDLFNRLGLRAAIKRLALTPSAATEADFTPRKVRVIDEAGELPALHAALRAAPHRGLVMNQTMDALGVAAGEQVWAVARPEVGDTAFTALLAFLLQEGEAPCILHDAKETVRRFTEETGRPCTMPAFDTGLAAYLLNPSEGSYTIPGLSASYLGFEAAPPSYNDEDAFNLLGMSAEALTALGQHAQLLLALYTLFAPRLEQQGMTSLLQDMELPLTMVLADMQRVGMAVDRSGLLQFGEELSRDMARLEEEIYAQAGEHFNISSPKQLGVILFERLGLKAGKKTKTGYSTDAEVLEKLRDAHPVVAAILDYRKLSKLKSTYVDGLTRVIGSDGRIHSTFHQTVAATGRLSSADPNLQNIPIRQKLGSEIRKFFVAAPGRVLIDADYSQIELRILAHIANDGVMLDAFRHGEDIHTVTASQVFDIPPDQVTPELRSRAKAINFGIVYGISAFSLSEDIGIYPKEAQAYIDAYLEKYTGVRDYMHNIREQAKADGYVTTLYGRRRYLPELKSSNFNVRSFGERVALNTPIQGTAADIIKLAMINIHRRLAQEGLEARLILQVHDELILEAPEGEAERVSTLLKEEMEGAASLNVRLTADVSWGRSWYDAKK